MRIKHIKTKIVLMVILALFMSTNVLAEEYTVETHDEYKEATKVAIRNQDTSIRMIYTGEKVGRGYLNDLYHLYYEAERELSGFEKQNRLRVYPEVIKNGVGSNVEIRYEVIYKNSKEDVEEIDKRIFSILEEILNEEMTDYEVIRAVYNFIADSYAYKKHSKDSYDIENLIKERNLLSGLDGEGIVCDAYTMLFTKMVTALGYENDMIIGAMDGGSTHIWNTIKIDGNWYNVDITNGDMDLQERFDRYKELFGDKHTDEVYRKNSIKDVKKNREKYFLVSSDVLEKKYSWDLSAYPMAKKSYNISKGGEI